jgi:hypothetical protein
VLLLRESYFELPAEPVLPLEPELPLVDGDGLIVPAEPVVPPLPTVPLELPPTPVLGALPLVLLPELEPARSSRRQSSFCVPVSASHLELVELEPAVLPPRAPPLLPEAPVLLSELPVLLPELPVLLPEAPVLLLPAEPEVSLEPVLLLPLIPVLPLPLEPLLPDVCAIETVAAPTSAAATAAHRTFIVIVGLLLRGKMLQAIGSKSYAGPARAQVAESRIECHAKNSVGTPGRRDAGSA